MHRSDRHIHQTRENTAHSSDETTEQRDGQRAQKVYDCSHKPATQERPSPDARQPHHRSKIPAAPQNGHHPPNGTDRWGLNNRAPLDRRDSIHPRNTMRHRDDRRNNPVPRQDNRVSRSATNAINSRKMARRDPRIRRTPPTKVSIQGLSCDVTLLRLWAARRCR